MLPGDLPVTRGGNPSNHSSWLPVGTHKQRPIRVRLSVRPATSVKPTDTRNGTFTRQDVQNPIHIPTHTIHAVTNSVVSPMLPCNNTGAVSGVALPVGASPSTITTARSVVTAVPPTVRVATVVPPAVTRIVLMNAHSVMKKTLLINEYVRDDAIDILAIIETWLKRGGDSAINIELAPDGYSFVQVPMQHCRGDGVGLRHREIYLVQISRIPMF